MNIWKTLDISPTKDTQEIKRAYAKQLKLYHPEEHPEEFDKLRRAYQTALKNAANNDRLEESYETENGTETKKTQTSAEEQADLFSAIGRAENQETFKEDTAIDEHVNLFSTIGDKSSREGFEDETSADKYTHLFSTLEGESSQENFEEDTSIDKYANLFSTIENESNQEFKNPQMIAYLSTIRRRIEIHNHNLIKSHNFWSKLLDSVEFAENKSDMFFTKEVLEMVNDSYNYASFIDEKYFVSSFFTEWSYKWNGTELYHLFTSFLSKLNSSSQPYRAVPFKEKTMFHKYPPMLLVIFFFTFLLVAYIVLPLNNKETKPDYTIDMRQYIPSDRYTIPGSNPYGTTRSYGESLAIEGILNGIKKNRPYSLVRINCEVLGISNWEYEEMLKNYKENGKLPNLY